MTASLGGSFAHARPPFEPRTHQRAALEAVDRIRERGSRRAWVVLPPGAGKTFVGLEVIRARGVPAVVLGPNTAIQMQWCRGWSAYDSDLAVGTDRDLAAPITSLTYQSLASFDDAGVSDARDQRVGDPDMSLIGRLHPNGRSLVDAMRTAGPVTVVLDECHHLLEVWGRLLAEVLDLLPDAFVLGLTATPPAVLAREQHALVEELFGSVTYAASIPAAVREGTLAPFAELARVTTPTPTESQWLAGQSERFSRLTTDLMEPGFGSVGFLSWLDRRFAYADEPWHDIERRSPALAAAAMRLSYAGLLDVPGARLREEHRHAPDADDWVALIDDWVRGCLAVSGDPADTEVVERIRRTLPGIGYQLTRRGIRRGRSPVDRVLARSAAKADECVEIVAAESLVLGDRLRLLVVCDHERASATTPESLQGVLDPESGSARLILARLAADTRTAGLGCVLVTGTTVAAPAATASRLLEFVREWDPRTAEALRLEPWPGDDIVGVVGGWSSRTWVPAVTRFFEHGHARVLVGTRALLGEGWDARGLNSLVDLSSATTTSAVVQTRGRALRTDPTWPDKVALTWSVVCVAEEHPRGATDWDRFVRKHDGYFGVDDEGDIVSGVSHVDSGLSPYAPPAVGDLPALNASMLVRAESRSDIAERWAVGSSYDDEVVHTIRIRDRRQRPPATERKAVVASEVLPGPRGPFRVSDGRRPWLHPWRSVRLAAREPGISAFGAAVADGLFAAGLSPIGAGALRVDVEPDGEIRVRLEHAGEAASRLFAESLDEALSAPADARYVLPRYVLGGDRWSPAWAGCKLFVRALRPRGVTWHAVPRALGVNAGHARAYAEAWNRWVSGGEPIYTGSPEGAGVLAASRGVDPLAVDAVLRPAWT